MRIFIFYLILVLFFNNISYSRPKMKEQRLKAIVVLKIIKFVRFKDEKNIRKLCIYKAPIFQHLKQNTCRRKNLICIKKRKKLNDLKNCDILFFSQMEKNNIKQINKLANKGMLVISDNKDYIHDYAHIVVYRKKTKIRFKINLYKAKINKLNFSSKLLKLAQIIEGRM